MAEAGSQGLLRILGVGFGLAVVVGGVIGQGILRTPGIVAGGWDAKEIIPRRVAAGRPDSDDRCDVDRRTRTSLPSSGGPYTFARRAFGNLVGLMTGWVDWLAQTATAAFISIVFAECVHRLGFLAHVSNAAIGMLFIAMLTALHLIGTRASGWSQNIGSAIKALMLIAIVAAFIFSPAHQPSSVSPVLTLAAAIGAMRAIYATYGGWNAAAYFCEEVRDIGRSLPRATFAASRS